MKYLRTEYEFILAVCKGKGIKGGDKKPIYDLYKKYIQPDINNWEDICNGCGTGIPGMFNKVRDFMQANKEKFID